MNSTLWFNTPAGMDVILLQIENQKHNNPDPLISADIKSITIAAAVNGIYIPKISRRYNSPPNTHESIQFPIMNFDYNVYHVKCAIVYLDGQIVYDDRDKGKMGYDEVLLLNGVYPRRRIDINRPKTPICKEHVCKLAAKYGFDTFDAIDFLERENINDINSLYEAPLDEWRPVNICRHCEQTYTESEWPRVCNICIQTYGCARGEYRHRPPHTRADISCKHCLFVLNNTKNNIRRADDAYNRAYGGSV